MISTCDVAFADIKYCTDCKIILADEYDDLQRCPVCTNEKIKDLADRVEELEYKFYEARSAMEDMQEIFEEFAEEYLDDGSDHELVEDMARVVENVK